MGYRNILGYKIQCTIKVVWKDLPKHVKVAWERRNLVPKKHHHWLLNSLGENCELPDTLTIDKTFYINKGFVMWGNNSDMTFDMFVVNHVILENIWWDHKSYEVLKLSVKTLGEEMITPKTWS